MALGFHLPALVPLVAPGPDALSIRGDLDHFHFSDPHCSAICAVNVRRACLSAVRPATPVTMMPFSPVITRPCDRPVGVEPVAEKGYLKRNIFIQNLIIIIFILQLAFQKKSF